MNVLPLPTPDRRARRCRRCNHPVPTGRLYGGYGSDCAELLGLIPPRARVAWGRQDGPTLFDQLNEEIREGDEMTPEEHYAEAEDLLDTAGDTMSDETQKPEVRLAAYMQLLAAAHVHATLALHRPPVNVGPSVDVRPQSTPERGSGSVTFPPQPGVRMEQCADDDAEAAR